MTIVSIIFILGVIIGSFWYPMSVSVAYIVLVVLFELYLYYVSFIIVRRLKFNNEADIDTVFNKDEKLTYRMYNVYFIHPFAAVTAARILSFIQLSSFILVPFLFYKSTWIPGILIALNYFAIGPLNVRLNPRLWLHDAVDHGKEKYLQEMELVDSVFEKTESLRRNKYTPILRQEAKRTILKTENAFHLILEDYKDKDWMTTSLLESRYNLDYGRADFIMMHLMGFGIISPRTQHDPKQMIDKDKLNDFLNNNLLDNKFIWLFIIDEIKRDEHALGSILKDCRPTIKDDILLISPKFKFMYDQINKPENIKNIAEVIENMTGKPITIKCSDYSYHTKSKL